jgi:hypothetical protein
VLGIWDSTEVRGVVEGIAVGVRPRAFWEISKEIESSKDTKVVVVLDAIFEV